MLGQFDLVCLRAARDGQEHHFKTSMAMTAYLVAEILLHVGFGVRTSENGCQDGFLSVSASAN